MTRILDKIEHSFWIKVVAAAVFLVMLYGNNALEIAKVKAESEQSVMKSKAETLESIEQNYVRQEVFQIIMDDLKDIKQMIRDKK